MSEKFLRDFMAHDDDFSLKIIRADELLGDANGLPQSEHCCLNPLEMCGTYPYYDDAVCADCYFHVNQVISGFPIVKKEGV